MPTLREPAKIGVKPNISRTFFHHETFKMRIQNTERWSIFGVANLLIPFQNLNVTVDSRRSRKRVATAIEIFNELRYYEPSVL